MNTQRFRKKKLKKMTITNNTPYLSLIYAISCLVKSKKGESFHKINKMIIFKELEN